MDVILLEPFGCHIAGYALESWQSGFFAQAYLYAANAYGGYALQNTGSTHRWAIGDNNGFAVCVSREKPHFHLLKEHHHHMRNRLDGSFDDHQHH
jgi:hypothetical protein